MITLAFTLVDMVQIEGLAIYLGDDYFSLYLRWPVQFEGLAVYFGDDYSNLHPRRRSLTRGADVYFRDDYFGIHPRRLVRLAEPAAYLCHHFAFNLAIRFEGLAVYLNIICFDCERSTFCSFHCKPRTRGAMA
jgi:hypothetical protein